MKEMVNNLYNHPSIAFWGMWNELDTWGNNNDLQGAFDAERVARETKGYTSTPKALTLTVMSASRTAQGWPATATLT